jgi:hypothetical protein
MVSDSLSRSTEQAWAPDAKSRLEAAIATGQRLLGDYFTEVEFAIWYSASIDMIAELYGPNSTQLHLFEGNRPISVWVGTRNEEVQLERTRRDRLRNHLAALTKFVGRIEKHPRKPLSIGMAWSGAILRFAVLLAAWQTIALVVARINAEFSAELAKLDGQLQASLADFNPAHIHSFYYQGVSDVRELSRDSTDNTVVSDAKTDKETAWPAVEQKIAEVRGGIGNLFRQVFSRGWVGFLTAGSIGLLAFGLCLMIVFTRQRVHTRWRYLLDILICTLLFAVLYVLLGTLIWGVVTFLGEMIYRLAKIPGVVAAAFLAVVTTAGWEIMKQLLGNPVTDRTRESE